MTRQAQNCINLMAGCSEEKILQAIQMLQNSVVEELMNHFGAGSRKELAMFLSEL